MKFIINSLLFSKQIQSLSGVLTNSNTVPIINCFHFHLDEGMLTIRATDLETTLVSKVEVETGRMDDINDVAVPSKLLLDIIKSMDDVPMTFSVEDTTYGISITSGEGKYRIAGKSPETFPNMPEAKDTTSIKLTSSLLVSAIGKTAFAASTDEMRPQMGGIFCDLTTENIPYVVLCDLNSVSMGEIETAIIKKVLPTSHTIGERTYGATGPLQPTSSINLNYGGPFGNIETMHHYIYTSTFEARIDGKVLEGTGYTPDQIILRKDHNDDLKPQLDAAIEYIKGY